MTFNDTCNNILTRLRVAPLIETKRWQSTDVNKHALRMKELYNYLFEYVVPDDLETLREEVEPYLPWADNHFEKERVSGHPINPGTTYKEWRYPASAAEHTDFEFSHSYAERYWPQYAGKFPGGQLEISTIQAGRVEPHQGIRHSYGSLADVVALLYEDPFTRQAYIPIFFPEDLTAARKKERIPCTLGYHFLCREGQLHIFYPMRSCDFTRHFRDDVYLTARLLLWVLGQLQFQAKRRGDAEQEVFWENIKPGTLRMNIGSLHCFESDL